MSNVISIAYLREEEIRRQNASKESPKIIANALRSVRDLQHLMVIQNDNKGVKLCSELLRKLEG